MILVSCPVVIGIPSEGVLLPICLLLLVKILKEEEDFLPSLTVTRNQEQHSRPAKVGHRQC
jgi:hypothetical protein